MAERFKKRHDNVLRAVDRLESPAEFNRLNFEAVEYQDEKGEKRRKIEMTFDGFMFLAMGFTGSEAAKIKVWYISQFNAMRRELQERATVPAIDLNNAAVVRQLLFQQIADAQRLEAQIAELAPVIVSHERLMQASKGSVLIREAALTLGIPQSRLVDWLIEHKWIYKNKRRKIRATASASKSGYVESVHQEYEHEGETRLAVQVYLTARGMATLSGKLTSKEYKGGGVFKQAWRSGSGA